LAETAIPITASRSFLRLNLLNDARGRVRLGTLNNLRWLAVVGQAVALLSSGWPSTSIFPFCSRLPPSPPAR